MHKWLVVGAMAVAGGALLARGAGPAHGVHAATSQAQIGPILAPHPDGPIWGAVDPSILGECSRGDPRRARRGRRRRLSLSHLAPASRSERLRLRARARRRSGAHDPPRHRRVAGALRLHRPPSPDGRRAGRSRGAARGLQGVHRVAGRGQRRAAREPRLLTVGVPHGHRRPAPVHHPAPLRRDSARPPRVRPEGLHPADDGHRRGRRGVRPARRRRR